MRNLLLAAGVAALAIAAPVYAQGRGHGQGHGNNGGHQDRGGPDHGGGHGNGHGNGNGNAHQERGRGGGHDSARADRHERQRMAQAEHGRGHQDRRAERGRDHEDRHAGRDARHEVREARRDARESRRTERRAVRLENAASYVRLMPANAGRPIAQGCPPGLARKYNGCMPPGQVRQQQRALYRDLWNDRYGQDDYYYDEGYLYSLGNNGSIARFVPLLGGALAPGLAWPTGYQSYPVPDYYSDYYGLTQPYDYRLADGAVYGVDPQTQAIRSIAALVTGDTWGIGQRIPAGYDVYNVPYAYRDQYRDTPDSLYRYSDGYVYQVDPTTQLIQAAIQLIT